jgi:hypothetical protein
VEDRSPSVFELELEVEFERVRPAAIADGVGETAAR